MCRCPDAGKATMGTITKAQAEEVGVHTTRHCSSRPEQAKRPEPTHVMLQDTDSKREDNTHETSFSRGKANHKTSLRLLGVLP